LLIGFSESARKLGCAEEFSIYWTRQRSSSKPLPRKKNDFDLSDAAPFG
jgi:hypothetical protein